MVNLQVSNEAIICIFFKYVNKHQNIDKYYLPIQDVKFKMANVSVWRTVRET